MTKDVDGLLRRIRFPIARFREIESRQQMTLDRLVQYARDEFDLLRSRNNTLAKRLEAVQPPTEPHHGPAAAHKSTKENPPLTRYFSFGELINAGKGHTDSYENQDDLLALTEGDQTSIAISNLPSMVTEPDIPCVTSSFIKRKDEDNRRQFPHHFLRLPRQRVQPSPVAGNSATTPNRVGRSLPSADIICYLCYAVLHVSTGCSHPICNMAAVISNYEK